MINKWSKREKKEGRFSFIFWALLLTMGVYGLQYAGWGRFFFAPLPPRYAAFEESFIELMASEEITPNGIKEWQAYELFDSEPIFLPTIWNHASRHITFKDLQEESPLMQRYDSVLDINKITLNQWLKVPDQWDLNPELFLNSQYTYGDWKGLYVQREITASINGKEGGYVLFKKIDGNEKDGERALFFEEKLPIQWDPLKGEAAILMIHLGEEGMIGGPILEQSSGMVTWDDYAMNHIQQWKHYHHLSPGYYRVEYWP